MSYSSINQIFYACLILIPFGICLRTSLRLLYGARGPQIGDPIYQMVNVASWVLTILPLAILIVASTLWLCWFLLLVAAYSGLEWILARRAMQRRSAWALLSGGLGTSQPTPSALHNHQGRFTGIVGRSFRQLVHSLEQGTELPAAIAAHRPALPVDAQAYAAIDAVAAPPQSDTSPRDEQRYQITDTMQNAAGQQLYQRFIYLCSVVLVMIGIVTFVAIKIVPSFQAIFDDFELELPSITTTLISCFSLFANSGIAVLIGLGFSAMIGLSILAGVMYLADFAVLRPITDRLFFTKHRALILRLFAIATERGQPMTTLVKQLTEGKPRYPSRFARSRLRKVLRSLSAGQDWKVALQNGSFIKTSDFPMLETSQQADNLPWVLRMMADQKVRTMVFRWTAFEQIAFPIAVMCVGLVVLFICVGLFIPLVELINGLT